MVKLFKGKTKKTEKKARPEANENKEPTEMETDRKTQTILKDVDEVVDIMGQNIQKATQRGETLDDLEAKTDALQKSSTAFKSNAKKVKRKMWWKNMKWTIILSVVGIIILIIILSSLGLTGQKK